MSSKSLQNELALDTPFEDIRHETVLNVVRTANLLTLEGAPLFRGVGLTEAQFNVLLALKYKSGDLTQSDLGKRLVVTRASITSVLDKLEGKRLVKRNTVPGNRRIRHVSLTRAGARLIDQVELVYRARIHRIMGSFSERECTALRRYLERVRAQIRADAHNKETSDGPSGHPAAQV